VQKTESLDTIIASIETLLGDLQNEPGLTAQQKATLASVITQLQGLQSRVDSLMHG
jgi:hypothetical protein